MTSIGIYGARGRMGQELCLAVKQSPKTVTLSALYEPQGHPEIGQKFDNVVLTDDMNQFLSLCNVVIDFTSPLGTTNLLEANKTHKKPLIIGTTGLSQEEILIIEEASLNYPIVFSPNYSIGVNLLFKVLEQAGKVLSKDMGYDLEVIELHHRFKKDSPSGTALKLAEVAAKASGRDLKKDGVYGREGMIGERTIDEIGVFALRAGDIVGEHSVIFTTLGERVEIAHKAHSRQTFAKGAVEAALWVSKQKKGLFSMQDVLGL